MQYQQQEGRAGRVIQLDGNGGGGGGGGQSIKYPWQFQQSDGAEEGGGGGASQVQQQQGTTYQYIQSDGRIMLYDGMSLYAPSTSSGSTTPSSGGSETGASSTSTAQYYVLDNGGNDGTLNGTQVYYDPDQEIYYALAAPQTVSPA